VPSARDLLERFRPAGTPGAAAPAGVPYDRAAALEDELRPVLALLAPTEQECAAVTRDATVRADRIRAEASASAAAELARARLDAESARAAAADDRRRRGDEEDAVELERAARTSADLGALARRRLPDLTARVVAATRAALTAPGPPAASGVPRPPYPPGSAGSPGPERG
jgi:hypothetical protein